MKIRESGTDTEEAVLISILAVILSGPEEVSGDSLDKIQDICSEVQRRSEEHEKGGAEGGVLDKGGVSLVKTSCKELIGVLRPFFGFRCVKYGI